MAIIVLIIVILSGVYYGLSRTSPIENYVSKDSIAFAYKTNSGKSGHIVEKLLGEVALRNSGNMGKNIALANKYISSAFISLQGGSGSLSLPTIIMGVHTKFYPIIQMVALKQYCISNGSGFYVLKPALQTQLVNGLSGNAYVQNVVRNGKIYVKPYKGYFLIGLSKDDINKYIGQIDSKNYSIGVQQEVIKLNKQSSLFAIFNVPEIISQTPLSLFYPANSQLKYIENYTEYANNTISINWKFIGQEGIFNGYTMPRSGNQLMRYSGNMNSIYISSENMGQTLGMIKLFAGKWIGAQGTSPIYSQFNQMMQYVTNGGSNSVVGQELLVGLSSSGIPYVAFTSKTGVSSASVIGAIPMMFNGEKPLIQNQGSLNFLNITNSNIKIGEYFNKNAFLNGKFQYKSVIFTLLGTSNGSDLTVRLGASEKDFARMLTQK